MTFDQTTAADAYRCPKCGERTTRNVLTETGYTCPRCTFEVAHLDVAPNGTVRQVLGWLRASGDVLVERYRVTGVLGKGGFAATYLVADDRLNGKRRALKEIPKDLYDEHETTLLARLHHPAIPDISDRFESDGMVYLVLEFGGSRSLEQERKAQGGRIAVGALLPWMRQLCDVLAYLHGQDPPVVHRDLKPDNILLDERDRVMLIDFGIAKEAVDSSVTRTVARSSSHGFSPPEQALGTGTDQRSDVYALGATMYALLTGTVPPAAHERVAGAELVAPRILSPAIPESLATAIARALDLNRNHRQQSIQELREVLDREAGVPLASTPDVDLTVRTERIAAPPPSTDATRPPTAVTLTGAPKVAAPDRAGTRARGLLVAAIVVVAVGAGLAAWLLPRSSPPETAPTGAVDPPGGSGAGIAANDLDGPGVAPVPALGLGGAPGAATTDLGPVRTTKGRSAEQLLEELRKKPPEETTAAARPPAREPKPPASAPKPPQQKRVVQRPAPPPAPRPAPPAARNPSAGSWGAIERKGARRTD